jgi:hypothetical protein
MSLDEEDLFDDLAFDEAEGAADAFDEFDEGDEFDEMDEADEFDEMDSMDEADEFDEFDEADEVDAYDEMDDFDGFDEEDMMDEDDEIISLISRALSAEDTDEFFRRVLRGLRGAARGVANVARRAAPVIGQVARGAGPLLSMIPHPAAQAAGRVAGVLGQLMADGASDEEALEAMAEVAARNRRAIPIVAGLAVRSIARQATPRMPLRQRQQMVRQATNAVRTLVQRRGPQAARAIPRIARSVRRTAATRGTPPAARARVLQRTARRVASNPRMVRQLARPNPAGRQVLRRIGVPAIAGGVRPAVMGGGIGGGIVRRVGAVGRRRLGGVRVGGARTITIRGPARITIRPI